MNAKNPGVGCILLTGKYFVFYGGYVAAHVQIKYEIVIGPDVGVLFDIIN